MDYNLAANNERATTTEVGMHCKHLIGLLVLLLLAASCVRNEEPAGQEAADATTQFEASAASPAEKAARPDSHTSNNSLDWAGTYSGVLPCADCPGIETVVTLRSDGTYERSTFYIDAAIPPQTATGTFTWDETGNKIELDIGDDEIVKYQVGENQLFHLDREGQRITGELAAHYMLKKHLNDPSIEGKTWKLVELRGKPIEAKRAGRDAVLTLRAGDSVASGSASCNTFSGSYAIKSGQQISFDRNMAVTMMACPDMSIESAFLEVLQITDNYSVSDGGKLSLNRARMAPLARFEVAEGKM